MLKKILVFSFVFLMSFSLFLDKGFAKDGFIPNADEPFYLGTGINNKKETVYDLTDGDEETDYVIPAGSNDVLWFSFPNDITVKEIYVKASQIPSNVRVRFFSSAQTLRGTLTIQDDKPLFVLPNAFNSVRYVTISAVDNKKDLRISEFGVNVEKVYGEIKNLLLVPTHNEVSLAWDIPSKEEGTVYTGAKIYRNGVFIDSVDEITNVYVDKDVEPNTVYNYKVAAVYGDGKETTGATSSITTKDEPLDPSLIPPSNVTDLEAKDITGTSARLTWKNSDDLDLDKVNIYNDDHSLLTSVSVTSEYTIANLNPETTYKFFVALVDVDGNVGAKMPVTFTTKEDIDTTPPDAPRGLSVDSGSNALYVKWDKNIEPDLAGYNIYVNGEKHNSVLVKNLFYSVPNLLNDVTYSISITAVDKSGNESEASTSLTGTPVSSGLPILETNYELKDVALGVESWFSSFWLIIAFAVSIPLSFYVASRIKLMFID